MAAEARSRIQTMACSMDNALQVIEPHLSKYLVPPAVLSRIHKLALNLAPVYWGGFECPLGGESSTIDFHQGLDSTRDVQKVLEAPLSRLNSGYRSAWDRIHQFLRLWSEPDSILNNSIMRIGLEFDTRETPELTPAPSIFWSFRRSEDGHLERELLQRSVDVSLKTLLSVPPEACQLKRFSDILDSSPDGATILTMGTMLSRPEKSLRVNIWGLNPADIPTFLKVCGWNHSLEGLEGLIDKLNGSVDSIVLGISLDESRYPKIGLECLPTMDTNGQHDWPALLSLLVEMGLCMPLKRDALVGWPGRSDPSSSSVPWPDDIVIESLLRSPATLSVFHRMLSHIKIEYDHGTGPSLKGYLAFFHTWVELDRERKTSQGG